MTDRTDTVTPTSNINTSTGTSIATSSVSTNINNKHEMDIVQKQLAECLLSQYIGFSTGVVSATAYSFIRKAPNKLSSNAAIGLIFVGGSIGSVADVIYGWNYKCNHLVTKYNKLSFNEEINIHSDNDSSTSQQQQQQQQQDQMMKPSDQQEEFK